MRGLEDPHRGSNGLLGGFVATTRSNGCRRVNLDFAQNRSVPRQKAKSSVASCSTSASGRCVSLHREADHAGIIWRAIVTVSPSPKVAESLAASKNAGLLPGNSLCSGTKACTGILNVFMIPKRSCILSFIIRWDPSLVRRRRLPPRSGGKQTQLLRLHGRDSPTERRANTRAQCVSYPITVVTACMCGSFQRVQRIE